MPMTIEKVKAVTDRYRTRIAGLGENYPDLQKVEEMLPMIDEFIQEGRREKAMRWLGFVQGLLWQAGIYTIPELADHNRPEDGIA